MRHERCLCQNCGAAIGHPHGSATRRWMRSGAALMVALPCAMAAAVVAFRSPGIAVALAAGAMTFAGIGLAIFLRKPHCPQCGSADLQLMDAVRPRGPALH